jgi:hypothetical protein
VLILIVRFHHVEYHRLRFIGGGPPNSGKSCQYVHVLAPILLLFALHGRRVGQALAPKTIAERLRSGGVWEAESNIDLLDLVPTPAAANRDASFTVERINL